MTSPRSSAWAYPGLYTVREIAFSRLLPCAFATTGDAADGGPPDRIQLMWEVVYMRWSALVLHCRFGSATRLVPATRRGSGCRLPAASMTVLVGLLGMSRAAHLCNR